MEYMRSGATYMDRYFFLRSKQNYKVIPEHFMFDKDSDFSTSHDFKAAELITYEFLCTHLNKQINNPELIDSFDFYKRLKWTKPKTALVELIYALYVSVCFNDGDVSIKEIASFFEKAFKIDLRDYYQFFIEIAKRKNHRAKFLETILINFEQKLIETDK